MRLPIPLAGCLLLTLCACSPSAAPVVNRSLPPAPAALIADRPLPAIRAGQEAGTVIAEQRAAAADERRRRISLAAWYAGVRRSYSEAR